MEMPTMIPKVEVSGFDKRKLRFNLESKLEYALELKEVGIESDWFADPDTCFPGNLKYKKPCPIVTDKFDLVFCYEETNTMEIVGRFAEAKVVVKNSDDKKRKEAILRLVVCLSPNEDQHKWLEDHLEKIIRLTATRRPEAVQENLPIEP